MYPLAPSPARRVDRGPLPNGDPGTRTTLERMRMLARDGVTHLAVREAAVRAVHGVAAHNTLAELDALFRFVRDRIRFTRDPVGTEWVQAPHYTLSMGSGDCDDMATLLAAMCGAIGIPCRFRAVAADRSRPQTYSHVYVVANAHGREIPMDPIYPSNVLGDQVPATRSLSWAAS